MSSMLALISRIQLKRQMEGGIYGMESLNFPYRPSNAAGKGFVFSQGKTKKRNALWVFIELMLFSFFSF